MLFFPSSVIQTEATQQIAALNTPCAGTLKPDWLDPPAHSWLENRAQGLAGRRHCAAFIAILRASDIQKAVSRSFAARLGSASRYKPMPRVFLRVSDATRHQLLLQGPGAIVRGQPQQG